jgi:NAD(P)-dependent dehydrogenase (short-subunit alcohol dehydrogenase family)
MSVRATAVKGRNAVPNAAEQDLAGRVYVVTGGNTGVGRATALDLAGRGAAVRVACRSEQKGREAVAAIAAETGNNAVEFVALDLADLASVRAAAERLLGRDEPLHVLINNAGVAGQRGVTADGFEMAFGVNHLGHFLFTTMLLDRLAASASPGAPARVVNVSSESHYSAKGVDFDAVHRRTRSMTGIREYGVSKLCNVLFTQELARRQDRETMTAYALHPGVVASDIWRGIPWPIRPLIKMRMIPTADGARTSLYCATSPDVVEASGRYYDNCREREPNPVATPELGARLWEQSEAWVKA